MSKKKKTARPKALFTDEDLEEARDQGSRNGYKEGLKAGVRLAKLEAFAICARENRPFTVYPSCYEHIMPWVEAQLRESGQDEMTLRAKKFLGRWTEESFKVGGVD